MLNMVRIVLVEPTHPGNIGATARAMKNMGLEQLYLVNPEKFPHADATSRASGADDLLARAAICHGLDEALAGCHLVVGASARLRRLSIPQWNPRQCAESILTNDAGITTAVVFGREHSGLTNDEMGRCHQLVHIPSNPDYSSLNLAAAVQVICYELRMAMEAGSGTAGTETAVTREEASLATADDMERFYNHLQETLVEIGFLDPENPRIMMRRLRRLFNRSRPDEVEMNILRGILTAAQKAKQ